MPATDGRWVLRSVLQTQCHSVARGRQLQTSLWEPCCLDAGAALPQGHGEHLSRCMHVNSPLRGLVCNCWLRWARCPEQSEASLTRQEEPHLCTGARSLCGSLGAAEHPLGAAPHASWSRGRRDRTEQGPGSSCGPQVGGVAPQLDWGSHSCSSRLLTGPVSCWQEGE